MDTGLAHVQAETETDEIFVGEDICYNHGLLVSPDTMREFLLPYYQQLVVNARGRQKRKIGFQVGHGRRLPSGHPHLQRIRAYQDVPIRGSQRM